VESLKRRHDAIKYARDILACQEKSDVTASDLCYAAQAMVDTTDRMHELLTIAEKNPPAAFLLSGLTTREYQVFWRMLSPDPMNQIAKEYDLSVKTLDTHRTSVLKKLQIKNRIALVRWAIREGLIQP
jgi:DNA-binding NarL/FixJ family response regulator